MSKVETTILKLIETEKNALSHQEIQKELGDLCNRVTIYRALDRLIQKREVHKVIDTNGVSKYAGCNHSCEHEHNHDHIHFSCQVCKKTTCLENVSLQFNLPDNYTLKETNFTMSGVCNQCHNLS
ncbi:MAG: Fur family transcriptional regulator [Cyclobacteriaceae bacterium]